MSGCSQEQREASPAVPLPCTPKTRPSSDIWHPRCCSFLLLPQINPGKQRRPLPLPLVPQRSPWLKMIQMGAYKNKRIYKKLQKSKELAVFQPRHDKKPFSLVLKCYPKRNLISFDKTNTSAKPLVVSALLSKDFRSQCQPANPEKKIPMLSPSGFWQAVCCMKYEKH